MSTSTEDSMDLEALKSETPVEALFSRSFRIPAYQRGYKWQPKQVKQLLNDVAQELAKSGLSRYCLQPLVVAKHSTDSSTWEVIDGQQRLTTVFLILKYLETGTFSLSFETRPATTEFLNRLTKHQINRDSQKADDTPDSYYLFHAWQTINRWFEGNPKQKEAWKTTFPKRIDFIWHEIRGDKPAQTFINFNSGKIHLTPSELVKAILVRRVSCADDQKRRQRTPEEIAAEWDTVERTFQKESFWAFLYPPPAKHKPWHRMGLILDMIASRESPIDEPPGTGALEQYLELNDNTDAAWLKIWECFLVFQEWFADRGVFHAIGFLRARSPRLHPLRDLWEKHREFGRSKFKEYLAKSIQNCTKEDLGNLRYGESNDQILNVLFWFNIATLPHYARFPFERMQSVSIEHIHAQNAAELSVDEKWKTWLSHTRDLLNTLPNNKELELLRTKLKNSAADNITDHGEKEKLIRQFSSLTAPGLAEEAMHQISNLALLSQSQNASLSNDSFLAKRRKILARHRAGDFVPPATREVFLKSFNGDENMMFFWTQEDRTNYLDEIRSSITPASIRRSFN